MYLWRNLARKTNLSPHCRDAVNRDSESTVYVMSFCLLHSITIFHDMKAHSEGLKVWDEETDNTVEAPFNHTIDTPWSIWLLEIRPPRTNWSKHRGRYQAIWKNVCFSDFQIGLGWLMANGYTTQTNIVTSQSDQNLIKTNVLFQGYRSARDNRGPSIWQDVWPPRREPLYAVIGSVVVKTSLTKTKSWPRL